MQGGIAVGKHSGGIRPGVAQVIRDRHLHAQSKKGVDPVHDIKLVLYSFDDEKELVMTEHKLKAHGFSSLDLNLAAKRWHDMRFKRAKANAKKVHVETESEKVPSTPDIQ